MDDLIAVAAGVGVVSKQQLRRVDGAELMPLGNVVALALALMQRHEDVDDELIVDVEHQFVIK